MGWEGCWRAGLARMGLAGLGGLGWGIAWEGWGGGWRRIVEVIQVAWLPACSLPGPNAARTHRPCSACLFGCRVQGGRRGAAARAATVGLTATACMGTAAGTVICIDDEADRCRPPPQRCQRPPGMAPPPKELASDAVTDRGSKQSGGGVGAMVQREARAPKGSGGARKEGKNGTSKQVLLLLLERGERREKGWARGKAGRAAARGEPTDKQTQ